MLATLSLLAASCGRPSPPTAPPATTEPPPSTAPAAGDPADQPVLPSPYTAVTTTLLTDPSGFPGAPAVSGDGTIFAAGLSGRLSALNASGEVRWETDLPDQAAGTPLVRGDVLYALDRAGLNAFTVGGDRLWRFEQETGSAIAGPAAGPDGTLYYTVQTGTQGAIQAVSTGGEPLWQAAVATHSYFRPPLVTPNGQFVLFRSEVFSTIDGRSVDLGLDFEPESFHVGADGQVYLLFESSLVRWTYADGRAVLADERVASPHELGPPVLAGVLENGEVWFVYPAAIAWFSPSGRMLQLVRVEEGFFTHSIDVIAGGLHIVCGRNRSDLRENGLPYCAAFSRDYDQALWNRIVAPEAAEFSGGAPLPDGAVVTLEDGALYRITYTESP